jgi:hypothetical protein
VYVSEGVLSDVVRNCCAAKPGSVQHQNAVALLPLPSYLLKKLHLKTCTSTLPSPHTLGTENALPSP